jgi:hypothetical protein
MSQTSYALLTEREEANSTMKALGFCGSGQIGLGKVPIPKPRAGEAVQQRIDDNSNRSKAVFSVFGGDDANGDVESVTCGITMS